MIRDFFFFFTWINSRFYLLFGYQNFSSRISEKNYHLDFRMSSMKFRWLDESYLIGQSFLSRLSDACDKILVIE